MRSAVQIPFRSFVRTNAGEMAEFQIEMMTENIKSVGISLLGGNSGVEGKYELGIDSIRFVNEEDMAESTGDPLCFNHLRHFSDDNAVSHYTKDEEMSEKSSIDEKQP